MVRTQRALFVVACLAAVAVVACNRGGGAGRTSGAKNEVVARVGGRPITRTYFEQRLERMERRFVPDTLDLAGRKEFLDFIVNKELMALKAEELKYGDDPRIVNALSVYENNLAANAAIEQLTEGKLDVSEAEIQQFNDQKQRVVVVKHIVLKTQREAEDVRKRLEGGANFDSIAAIYSSVPRTDATGAELTIEQRTSFGEVKYGDAIPPVEDAVFSTPVNQVTQPVESGYGWHIFKVLAEKTVRVAPLDPDSRSRLEKQIQARRKRAITEAYFQEIAAAHGLKMDEDAIIAVYEQLPPDADPESRPDPATEVKPVIAFSAADRARTLLEVDGRKVTIGEFSDKYDATSWFERPKRTPGALGLKYWIRDKWYRDLQLARARKDGIYETPAVADEIKMRREQMMVTMLHQNMVGDLAPEPTPEQVQKFYDDHTKFYIDHEKRVVSIVFNQQERVVRRAYEEVQGGKDFVEVAVAYNENALTAQDVQTAAFTRDAEDYKEIAPATFALAKTGDRTEPLKTSQGWVLMQLAAIFPERQMKLDEIREAVAADWKNQWQEDKLNELLAEWKKGVKVEIDEKALMNAAVNRTDVFVPGRPAGAAGN